jgi:hypothetical protein
MYGSTQDLTNATAVALRLLLAVEGQATQWDHEGRPDDAARLRAHGPAMAAGLADFIASDPAATLPLLAVMLHDITPAQP